MQTYPSMLNQFYKNHALKFESKGQKEMLLPRHLHTVVCTMDSGSEQRVPILQSYQDAPWSLLSVSVKLESKNISL